MRIDRALASIGWGLVLTSSWTWCIGLFLPVLLIKLFGWTGFWLFAIPNVIGCTAFGWIVSGKRGVALARRLRNGIVVFALWTIAFQAFFLARLFLDPSVDAGVHGMGLAAVVIVIGAALTTGASREPSTAAWMLRAAAGAALGVAAWCLSPASFMVDVAATPLLGSRAAWAAGPFIALGFLACPLLDPTFHWVRERAGSAAPFGWFGLFFAATLALTGSMAGSGSWHLTPLLGVWVVFQVIFTLVLNARCVEALDAVSAPGAMRRLVSLACVAGGAVAAIAWLVARGAGVIENSFDVAYLGFLGAYSTIFPTLVFLGGSNRTALLVATSLAAVGLAVPGVFGGATITLTIATAVIIAVPLASARLKSR
ncbi:MAG: hypothetical protein O2855_02615 [Planctomycetota bacterium]|nr:hypothetical protein [Planctomycetota bacterium]